MQNAATTVEDAVRNTYSAAAHARQGSLCCPVSYDPQYLKVIPTEVLDRDYGCGNPSEYVRAGDTVLDLGSGGGKICFIAAQIVGATGHVIGIDMNDDMLALARKNQPIVAGRIGYSNVEFHKGAIQDLQLDLADTEQYLQKNPISSLADLQQFNRYQADQNRRRPLVRDESIDVVVSNCVLNLVRSEDKQRLFGEIFRVLKMGGRAAISDIVSDEDVPEDLQRDPDLWSGCVSGAMREDLFLQAFEQAGFFGIELVKRDAHPWRTVRGIEFRSVTVVARKGKQGPCLERGQAVIYAGPWKQVVDDDGHVLARGKPMAVCDKTFHIMTSTKGPYAKSIFPVPPRVEIPLTEAKPFACKPAAHRHPRETKGLDYNASVQDSSCCAGDGCC